MSIIVGAPRILVKAPGGLSGAGLAALAIVLTMRAATVGAIAFLARPGGVWLFQLIEHLI